MKSRSKNEYLANLLGEVKFQEKKVDKLKAKLPVVEARIKQALKAGDRELAKKYAIAYEEQKLEIQHAEQRVEVAKKQYTLGRQKAREAKSVESLVKMTEAMSGLADSMAVLNRDDDMLEKIEEQAALSEAKLELAMEDAERKSPGITMEPLTRGTTAEDILKEFEGI